MSIREWSAAYYGQAVAGKGILDYNGGRHHFTISGAGVGGSGVQKVSDTGKVYNKLTNQNGVVMYLAGQTEGLASSLGAQAFEVNLTN